MMFIGGYSPSKQILDRYGLDAVFCAGIFRGIFRRYFPPVFSAGIFRRYFLPVFSAGIFRRHFPPVFSAE